MRSSKKTALGMAGALGIAGLGIAVVGGPALAARTPTALSPSAVSMAATTDDDSTTDADGIAERTTQLKKALAGLVGEGTLTQAQADEVAATLAESSDLRGPAGGHGPGVRGPNLETAAATLGLTEDEVRAALADGSTLADLAGAQGVDVQTLVDDLVDAATAELQERVAAGDLSQDRADEIIADLPDLVADMVENGRPARGHGGPGMRGGPGETRDDGTGDSTDGGSGTNGTASSLSWTT